MVTRVENVRVWVRWRKSKQVEYKKKRRWETEGIVGTVETGETVEITETTESVLVVETFRAGKVYEERRGKTEETG